VIGANNSARPTARFEPPAPAPLAGMALESQTVGTEMNNSPYLDRPLIPLAVALPRMLAKIEADLATARPAESRRLRQRAELIRGLLAPSGFTSPVVT
jgi:hypothetical protein